MSETPERGEPVRLADMASSAADLAEVAQSLYRMRDVGLRAAESSRRLAETVRAIRRAD